MLPVAVKKKNNKLRISLNTYQKKTDEYKRAWEQLDKLSIKLNSLWKTKKNSLQILKEEKI